MFASVVIRIVAETPIAFDRRAWDLFATYDLPSSSSCFHGVCYNPLTRRPSCSNDYLPFLSSYMWLSWHVSAATCGNTSIMMTPSANSVPPGHLSPAFFVIAPFVRPSPFNDLRVYLRLDASLDPQRDCLFPRLWEECVRLEYDSRAWLKATFTRDPPPLARKSPQPCQSLLESPSFSVSCSSYASRQRAS